MEPTPTSTDFGARVRAHVPFLVRAPGLAYLDNAATTQKPERVLEALLSFYTHDNGNVKSGGHQASRRAREVAEDARARLAAHIGAAPDELILTTSSTDAIRLVALSFVGPRLNAGDVLIATALDHAANRLPYEVLCQATGAEFRLWPLGADGQLAVSALEPLLDARVKLVAMPHVSNATGAVAPVARATAACRVRGIATLVDGAQALPQRRVDVQALGATFYVASGHKAYAPAGAGLLYAASGALDDCVPVFPGFDSARSDTTDLPVPVRFEQATLDTAAVVGLVAALDWRAALGDDSVTAHTAALADAAATALAALPGVRVLPRPTAEPQPGAIVSFTVAGVAPQAVEAACDAADVCVRAGGLNARPTLVHFGIEAAVRASFAAYSTQDDVARLVDAVSAMRTA